MKGSAMSSERPASRRTPPKPAAARVHARRPSAKPAAAPKRKPAPKSKRFAPPAAKPKRTSSAKQERHVTSTKHIAAIPTAPKPTARPAAKEIAKPALKPAAPNLGAPKSRPAKPVAAAAANRPAARRPGAAKPAAPAAAPAAARAAATKPTGIAEAAFVDAAVAPKPPPAVPATPAAEAAPAPRPPEPATPPPAAAHPQPVSVTPEPLPAAPVPAAVAAPPARRAAMVAVPAPRVAPPPSAGGVPIGPQRHMPPPRPLARAESFVQGDHVVYPTHGVGKVERIATEEIAGHKLELIHITFEENRMTLRVPVAKARTAGLRKLASRKMFDEALAVLHGRARIKRTMWSRRAQEYEAKINSGDPLAIAEVVRDLHRNAGQPDQSFSERQIYEAAMDRLAAELAALDQTDKATAAVKLGDFLKAA
jgi:CarD family transcriptional regulator